MDEEPKTMTRAEAREAGMLADAFEQATYTLGQLRKARDGTYRDEFNTADADTPIGIGCSINHCDAGASGFGGDDTIVSLKVAIETYAMLRSTIAERLRALGVETDG